MRDSRPATNADVDARVDGVALLRWAIDYALGCLSLVTPGDLTTAGGPFSAGSVVVGGAGDPVLALRDRATSLLHAWAGARDAIVTVGVCSPTWAATPTGLTTGSSLTALIVGVSVEPCTKSR